MSQSTRDHWNNVYTNADVPNLGWYEETPAPSLRLFEQCQLEQSAAVLDVGVGATTLIDALLEQGYHNLTAVDISAVAIGRLQERLGEKAASVRWIVDDLTAPLHLNQLSDITFWHDRAVLHFLTGESQRQSYFDTLKRVVEPGGYVMIAAFAIDGAKKCSGLDVHNYDSDMLAAALGDEFTLIDSFDYLYTMPSGDTRPFVYTLFRRAFIGR
jgi:EEF1A lysine methyltransferase 2